MTRFMQGVSRLMALLGGAALTLVILITCLSILGRVSNTWLHVLVDKSILASAAQWLIDIGIGPVKGDFELAEALMAFAIFAFLPFTQMTNGHASVDIFTAWLPSGGQRVLRFVIEALFAVVLVVLCRQLFIGMESKMRSGQTTFILQFPIWWAYAASFAGSIIAAVVGVYMALIRAAEVYSGRVIIADEMGAEH